MGTEDTVTRRGAGGFTFLELIVVISILAILTAIIVPVFGDSVSAMKRRSARGDFVALVYFVQELAVRESRELRLYIDTRQGAYWVEGWVDGHGDDKVFEALPERSQGGVRHFPEQFTVTRIQARTERGRGLHYIAFFPTGACDKASIQVSNGGRGEGRTTIATTGVLGGVEVSS